jgi:hypothetical protein
MVEDMEAEEEIQDTEIQDTVIEIDRDVFVIHQ